MPQAKKHTQPLLQLMASKWTIPVIYTLQNSALRYGIVEKALPGITQRALTNTLRNLERNGMVERRAYPTIPPQVEYKLTSLGLEFLTLSKVLSEWTDEHAEKIKQAQKAYIRRIGR